MHATLLDTCGVYYTTSRLALTMDTARKFSLPHNPIKAGTIIRFSSLPILWSRTNPTFGDYMEYGRLLAQMQSPNRINGLAGSRVERSAPCYRVRPLGLRLPSKRTSPFFGGYPSSNRTCGFPAYGSPCGTGFIGFAPLRLSAPFHIDSEGCSSIWTSGFRRAAT